MAEKKLRILHIYEDSEHTLEETTREVLRLLGEGYTSGKDPDWDIEEQ
jgi:hypothetical protein